MADETPSPGGGKPGGSSFKQLLVIGLLIVIVEAAVVYFVVVPRLSPSPHSEETSIAGTKGKHEKKKRTTVRSGEKPAEAGTVEIKDQVINFSPAGGGSRMYLMISMVMEYELSKGEVEDYGKKLEKEKGGGEGEGEGAHVFEKAEGPRIKHKIIEFFSSKTEAELTAPGAIGRLPKELRRTLNRMINGEDETVPATPAPSMPPEGGEMTPGGTVEQEEEEPHPIMEIYFTSFVLQ